MALREGRVENNRLLRDKPMARHTAQKPDTLTVINWRQKYRNLCFFHKQRLVGLL